MQNLSKMCRRTSSRVRRRRSRRTARAPAAGRRRRTPPVRSARAPPSGLGRGARAPPRAARRAAMLEIAGSVAQRLRAGQRARDRARAARRARRRSARTRRRARRQRRPRRTDRGRSALFLTITRGRVAGVVEQRRSSSVSASLRSSTTSTRSDAARACTLRATPSRSIRSLVSRAPAVSTSVSARPSMSTRSVTRSRVVPGTSVTMARSAPTSALNRLDLPTLGRPAITTVAPSRIKRPRARVGEQRVDRGHDRRVDADWRRPTARRSDNPRPGKSSDASSRAMRSNSSASMCGDARGQRAVELIERHARLQRRGRVDQIGHRLGLHQIALAVEERAQRELARLGEPRAGAHGRAHDAVEQDRAAVRADLDDVLAGVGVWRREAERRRRRRAPRRPTASRTLHRATVARAARAAPAGRPAGGDLMARAGR